MLDNTATRKTCMEISYKDSPPRWVFEKRNF